MYTRLEAERRRVGYTQRRLAKASGISTATLSRLEHSKGSISIRKLQRIAAVLKVPIVDLIEAAMYGV